MPEEALDADSLLPEQHVVTHSLYDVTYDVILRTITFVASYLIYLLIMFIVLDFWDKLKEPTKQFLRSKIEKYVDRQTIEAYVQLTTSSDRPGQAVVDTNRPTNVPTVEKRSRHIEEVQVSSGGGASSGEIKEDYLVAKSEEDEEEIPTEDANEAAASYLEGSDSLEEVDCEDVEEKAIKENVDDVGIDEEYLINSEKDHVELFVKDTINKALQQFQSEEKLKSTD